MYITTDSFLRIGKTHSICEDYIIHGYEKSPHVILADGCSSSSNTDIGARTLVHIAKQNLAPDVGEKTILIADIIHKLLHLNKTTLDATLIVSYVKDKIIHIHAYGDGVIILVDKFNNVTFNEIIYNNNAPYYLTYTIDKVRNELYVKQLNKKFINGTEYPKLSGIHYNFSTEVYKTVLISSDGISSFLSNEKGILETTNVVNELVNFKNTTGRFIQRRCIKMIKDYEKNGYFHFDDLSIGGFYINHDNLREGEIE